jgi:hypothetical protein
MEKRENRLSEWLERLQQESWQLELLISGFLLSLLLGAKEEMSQLMTENGNLLTSYEGGMLYFIMMSGFIACNILVINLVVHVLLRSLWIGAIGLRNISGDIDLNNIELSPFFRAHLQKKLPTFDQFIERLENFCCLVFAFTFLIIFSILSFFSVLVITSSLIYVLGNFFHTFFPSQKLLRRVFLLPLMLGFFIFGLLYLIDFITLGRIKRIKWLNKIYFPFYRFFSIVSFSSVYRPLYYNMIDNPLGRKVMLSIVPYLAILLLYISIGYEDTEFFPVKNNYFRLESYFYSETNTGEYDKDEMILNKKYVENGDFLEVFLPFSAFPQKMTYKSCTQSLEKNKIGFNRKGNFAVQFSEGYNSTDSLNVLKLTNLNIDSLENKKFKADFERISCIASHFEIFVGDSLQRKVNYDFYQEPKTKQKGILATVDVLTIPRGKHFLNFKIKDSTDHVAARFSIPFWKK